MAQRYDYYFLQPVTEEELNEGFAGLENADRALMTDQALVGIFSGGVCAQHAPVANLTVDVSGPVIGYDDFGQRILAPGPTLNVNVAQDSSSVSTAVAGSSNEKWVSIALQFTRVLTDPREDGNSQTVYFNEAESYLVIVTQGAEAAVGTAPRPSIDPDNLLLCDVNLRFGTTQVFNAALDTTRRQDVFVMAGSPFSIRSGTLFGAVESMLVNLNDHVNNLGGAHPASAIAISGLSAWADGTLNSGFTDLYDFIETGLITALAGTGGTAKIGGAALSNFLDGQGIAAGTLLAQLNGFVAALSSSTASHDGARRVYYNPAGSSTPLTATTVGGALDQIDANFHTYVGTTLPGLLSGLGTVAYHWTAAETFDSIAVTASNHYGMSSRSITRSCAGGFELFSTHAYYTNASVTVGASDVAMQALDVPHGATLTKATILVVPSNGTPPAGSPVRLQINKVNLITGAQTPIVTTNDPTTGSAYGTIHSFSTGTVSEVIDRTTYRYWITAEGETGSGAAQAFFYGASWTATVTGIDDGVA
jgi:hypothetical protein